MHGMKILETSPGNFDIACEISGRPHTRTNQYGMFCDDPNCECERKSMEMFNPMNDFIKAAAGMFERGEKLDVDALRDVFLGKPKD